jgi:hypothetical protein
MREEQFGPGRKGNADDGGRYNDAGLHAWAPG